MRSSVSGACIRRYAQQMSFDAAKVACADSSQDHLSYLWSPHDSLELATVSLAWGNGGGWIAATANNQNTAFIDGSDTSILQNPTKDGLGRWLLPASALFHKCDGTSACFQHNRASHRQTHIALSPVSNILENTVLQTADKLEEKAFFCEITPMCEGDTGKGSVLQSMPGLTCALQVEPDVQYVEFEMWGAGGQSTKSAQGGAGGYAGGAVKVRDESYFVLQVGGFKHAWDFSLPTQDQTRGAMHQWTVGGGRSALLFPGRGNTPVNYMNEIAVAAGGGGAGTKQGGSAVAMNGAQGNAQSVFAVSGSIKGVATGGQSAVQSSPQGTGAKGGMAGQAASQTTIPTNTCATGTSGNRNMAGTPTCVMSSGTSLQAGGGGGGGYFGGGSGVALNEETVSGGGGGVGFVHAQVLHGSLMSGDAARPPRQESSNWFPGYAEPNFLSGAIHIKLQRRALRCWPDTRFVLSAPGVQYIETPAGALSVDVQLWGAGGSPPLDDVSDQRCAGGYGGYAFARMASFPTNPLFISIGNPSQKYADSASVIAFAHSGMGGPTNIVIQGLNENGIGAPYDDDGKARANRGGGTASTLWAVSSFDPWLVAGGGGGGSGSPHGSTAAGECAKGGNGGGLEAEAGAPVDAVAGGKGGSSVEGGAGGFATPHDGYVAFGEDGLMGTGGVNNQALCGTDTLCISNTASGGGGLWGGGAGAAGPTGTSGAGGGSSFASMDVALVSGNHPAPEFLGAIGYNAALVNNWRRFQLQASEPGFAGLSVLDFRCTDCDDPLQCSIVDETGAKMCFNREDQKPAQFAGDIHSQCYHCDPADVGGYRMWSQRAAGASCNDALSCTKNDKCTERGLCQGESYQCLMFQFSNDPSKDCEQCVGDGTCEIRDDYDGAIVGSGADRVCGCLIGGHEFPHGAPNPQARFCQFCDVTVSRTQWSTRPDGLQCNDGQQCTFEDVCESGVCVGTAYTCEQQECHVSFECNGKGGCIPTYRAIHEDFSCGSRVLNECQLSPVCDGHIATCPGYSSGQPIVSPALRPPSITVLQSEEHVHGLFRADDPIEVSGGFLTQSNGLLASVGGFDVACDSMELTVGLLKIRSAADAGKCDQESVKQNVLPQAVHACPSGWQLLTTSGLSDPRCVLSDPHPRNLSAAISFCHSKNGELAWRIRDAIAARSYVAACAKLRTTCWTGLHSASNLRWGARDEPFARTSWGTTDWIQEQVSHQGHILLQGHYENRMHISVENDTAAEHAVMCETAAMSCATGWDFVSSPNGAQLCVKEVGNASSRQTARALCSAHGGTLPIFDRSDQDLMQQIGAGCSAGACWLDSVAKEADVIGINAAHRLMMHSDLFECKSCASLVLLRSGGRVETRTLANLSTVCVRPTIACPHDSVLIPLTGSGQTCIQLIHESYSEADSQCADLGGSLAIPHSRSDVFHLAGVCSRGESCRTGLEDSANRQTWGGQSALRENVSSHLPLGAVQPTPRLCANVEWPQGEAATLIAAECGQSVASLCALPPERCVGQTALSFDTESNAYQCVGDKEQINAASQPMSWGAVAGGSSWLIRNALVQFKQAQTEFARWVDSSGYVDLVQHSDLQLNAPAWLKLEQASSYKLVATVSNNQGDSLTSCSDVFSVDVTPPAVVSSAGVWEVNAAGSLIAGGQSNVDIDFQSTNTLAFRWAGFFDAESSFDGILEYHFCVTAVEEDVKSCATKSAGKALSEWRRVPPTGYYEYRELGLLHGAAYRVHIMAYNQARHFTTLSSNGTVYDATAPISHPVWDVTALSPASDAVFTNESSLLRFSWNAFTEEESYLSHYEIQLGTVVGRPTDNVMQVVRLESAATSFEYEQPKEFASGTVVFAALKAFNAAGLSSLRLSNGVRIDTTTPAVHAFLLADEKYSESYHRSVLHADNSHSGLNVTKFAGSFDAGRLRSAVQFSDLDSCFDSCFIAVTQSNSSSGWLLATAQGEHEAGQCALSMPFTVNFSPSLQSGHANLQVKCLDRSGNTGYSTAQPFHIETQAPNCSSSAPVIRSHMFPLAYLPKQTNVSLDEISVSWQLPSTGYSKLTSTWLCVEVHGLCEQELDVSYRTQFDTSIGHLQNFTGGNVDFVVAFYVSTGASCRVSTTVFVDTSAPHITSAKLNAGLFRETFDGIAYTAHTSSLSIVWDGLVELETAIVGIEYTIGSCPGSTAQYVAAKSVQIFKPLNASDTLTLYGINLIHGLEYCVSAKWWNSAGLSSKELTSNKVSVDLTPPVLGSALATLESGIPTRYQSNTSVLFAAWKRFGTNLSSLQPLWNDNESGILSSSCCASSDGIACDIESEFTMLHEDQACRIDLTLPLSNGQLVFVIVNLTNHAGLWKTTSTAGVIIDATTPKVETSDIVVGHGTSNGTFVNADESSVFLAWPTWDESPNHPDEMNGYTYSVALGHTTCDASLVPMRDIGFQRQVLLSGFHLNHSHTYCATLVAYGAGGATSSYKHLRFIVDLEAPTAHSNEIKLNATGQLNATQYLMSASNVGLSWAHFVDDTQVSYSVAVGTTPFGQHALKWTSQIFENSLTVRALEMLPGVHYFVTIVARDSAGMTSSLMSPPVVLDITPPQPQQIAISPSKGVKHGDIVWCSWPAFVDEQTPIVRYEYRLLWRPQGASTWLPAQTANKSEWTNADSSLSPITTDGFDTQLYSSLKHLDALRCEVRGFNAAGWRSTSFSAPTQLFLRGPSGGNIDAFFGLKNGVAKCSRLTVAWWGFQDPAGIEAYSVKVSFDNGTDLYHKHGIRMLQHIVLLNFTHGMPFKVSVSARSNSGLETTRYSKQILCDDSSPYTGTSLQLARSWPIVWPFFSISERTGCDCQDPSQEFVVSEGRNTISSTCQQRDSNVHGLSNSEDDIGVDSCGPGRIFDATKGECSACPLGTFKVNLLGAPKCLVCGNTHMTLSINTSHVHDAESSLKRLVFGVGSSPSQLQQLFQFPRSGPATLKVPMQSEDTVFVTMNAENNAGGSVIETHVTNEANPKLEFAGAVQDRWLDSSNDVDFSSASFPLRIVWSNFQGPTHGLVYFRCAWGLEKGSADFGWTAAPAVRAADSHSGSCELQAMPKVSHPTRVFGTVVAASEHAQTFAIAHTDGVLLDNTAPHFASAGIRDDCQQGISRPQTAQTRFVADSENLQICWNVFDGESPLTHTRVQVFGPGELLPFHDENTTAGVTVVHIPENVWSTLTINVSLTTTNLAGLSTTKLIRVVVLPRAAAWGPVEQIPISQPCQAAPQPHFQSSGSSLSFKWPQSKPLAEFLGGLNVQIRVSIGLSAGGNEIVDDMSLPAYIPGSVTQLHGLKLVNGARHFVSIHAEFEASLRVNAVSSQAITAAWLEHAGLRLSSTKTAVESDEIRHAPLPISQTSTRWLQERARNRLGCSSTDTDIKVASFSGRNTQPQLPVAYLRRRASAAVITVDTDELINADWTVCLAILPVGDPPLQESEINKSEQPAYDDFGHSVYSIYDDVEAGIHNEQQAPPCKLREKRPQRFEQYDEYSIENSYYAYSLYEPYDEPDACQTVFWECSPVTSISSTNKKFFNISRPENLPLDGWAAAIVQMTSPTGQIIREVSSLIQWTDAFDESAVIGAVQILSGTDKLNRLTIPPGDMVTMRLPHYDPQAPVELASALMKVSIFSPEASQSKNMTSTLSVNHLEPLSESLFVLKLEQQLDHGDVVYVQLDLVDALSRQASVSSAPHQVDAAAPVLTDSILQFSSNPKSGLVHWVPYSSSENSSSLEGLGLGSTTFTIGSAERMVVGLGSLSDENSGLRSFRISAGTSLLGAQVSNQKVSNVQLHGFAQSQGLSVSIPMTNNKLEHLTSFYLFATATDIHLNSRTWVSGPFRIDGTPPVTPQGAEYSQALISCVTCKSTAAPYERGMLYIPAQYMFNETALIEVQPVYDHESGIARVVAVFAIVTPTATQQGEVELQINETQDTSFAMGPFVTTISPLNFEPEATTFGFLEGSFPLSAVAPRQWLLGVSSDRLLPASIQIKLILMNGVGSNHTIHLPAIKVDVSPPIWPERHIFAGDLGQKIPSCLALGPGRTLEIFWGSAHDEESPIDAYFISIGTAVGDDRILRKHAVGLRTLARIKIIDALGTQDENALQMVWPTGQRFFVNIIARNAAGLESAIASLGTRALCDPSQELCEEGRTICLNV